MPLQSRAAQGFARDAVEIDLILKGIKTMTFSYLLMSNTRWVEIDLILKGIKTNAIISRSEAVKPSCGNRPDSQRD